MPKRWGIVVIVALTALFCVGFPFIFLGDPNAPGATGFMLKFTILPGGFLLGAAVSLSRLRIELHGQRKTGSVRLRLPKAGTLPWAPWTLHSREIPASEISRVDVVLEPHATESDGIARRYILRTKQGDYQFSSLWFSSTEIFDRWCQKSMIELRQGTANQIMDNAALETTEPSAEASTSQRVVRACGRVIRPIALLVMAASVVALLFADWEGRWIAAQAFVAAGALTATAPLLINYRHVK